MVMAIQEENRGYKKLLFQQDGPVLKIIINIPEKRNALDMEIRPELIEVLQDLAFDSTVRVVILAGHGEHFCGGGDINSMKDVPDPVASRNRLKYGHRLVRAMVQLEKPIIAQVDGAAAGSGVSLVLASDLAVAAERAKFHFSFARIGLAPDWGQYYFLPQRVGMVRAKELMLEGGVISARRAEQIGMINRVVATEDLVKTTWDWAQKLAQGPSQAYALIKSALNRWPMDLESYLDLEASLQAVALGSDDFKEGRQAFLEKRKPNFR